MGQMNVRKTPVFRMMALTVLAAFAALLPAKPSDAQESLVLPLPGRMVLSTRHFEPAQMVGLKVNLKDPFSFGFIMDQGESPMSEADRKAEFNKIIKYFLVSLAMPNKDMWVNLSPYESGRIVPETFGQTEMGRDLLAEDYILKQFTASLIYPESGLGKQFWAKVYQESQQRFGTTNINVNTFNKVWIVADKADIYQKGDTGLLIGSHLKVMLEQDFMAIEKNKEQFGNLKKDTAQDAKAQMASRIVREIIIPAIEKEVNEGRNFAAVRQVYSAEIMATWFKKTLRESLLGQVFADKSKVAGQEVDDPKVKEKIYKEYLKAYKKGVFNFIKEDQAPGGEMIPRKYFSGGFLSVDKAMLEVIDDNSGRFTIAQYNKINDFTKGMRETIKKLTLLLVVLTPLTGNVLNISTGNNHLQPKAYAIYQTETSSKATQQAPTAKTQWEFAKADIVKALVNETHVAKPSATSTSQINYFNLVLARYRSGLRPNAYFTRVLDPQPKEFLRYLASMAAASAASSGAGASPGGASPDPFADILTRVMPFYFGNAVTAGVASGTASAVSIVANSNGQGPFIQNPNFSSSGGFAQAPFAAQLPDAAQLTRPGSNVGGINLSDEHLTMNVRVDGQGMPLPMQFQDKAMLNLRGLTSVIREITPISPQNAPELFELMKS